MATNYLNVNVTFKNTYRSKIAVEDMEALLVRWLVWEQLATLWVVVKNLCILHPISEDWLSLKWMTSPSFSFCELHSSAQMGEQEVWCNVEEEEQIILYGSL